NVRVGKLPDPIAALVHTSSICEEMAVTGSLTGDPRLVYQAVAFDPLSSAVLGLREIKDMTKAMFKKNTAYLPQFKSFEF
ncbi:MAG: alpha-glucosidase/alpha-galactosidase, partial [Kiritimatiellaeota bacterium]|nr:alpha-glucosidase/alpha-galactosidase [Kiritimatiellota bacterium]